MFVADPGGVPIVLRARNGMLHLSVHIQPEKNTLLYDGADFFIFEETLDPGQTRARHSHAQRLVIVLNATRLQQWPDGQPEVFRDQVPDDVHFNRPVVHMVRTVGEKPLRNIVIEFKPAKRATATGVV
jgi:hypothetical protein